MFSFLYFLSVAAFAECPSIQDVFNFDALQALSHVQNQPDYRLEFLYSTGQKKMVVLLGESHLKSKSSSLAGVELLKHFRLRGIEGSPWSEWYQHSFGERAWANIRNFFASWNKKYSYRSTIDDATYDSVLLGLDDVVYEKGQKTEVVTKTIGEFYDQYRQREYLTVWLERGEPIDVEFYKQKNFLHTVSDEYTIDCRNDRMTKNIIDTLNVFPDPTMLVIVGSYHLPGLIQNLNKSSDFEVCSY